MHQRDFDRKRVNAMNAATRSRPRRALPRARLVVRWLPALAILHLVFVFPGHPDDYVLRVLKSYVVGYGRDDTLFVIVGDHQPAAWVVGGDAASFDVPIHVLSRDSAVLDTAADWGWSSGMRPDAAAPVWRMEEFRERFLVAFSAGETAHRAAPRHLRCQSNRSAGTLGATSAR